MSNQSKIAELNNTVHQIDPELRELFVADRELSNLVAAIEGEVLYVLRSAASGIATTGPQIHPLDAIVARDPHGSLDRLARAQAGLAAVRSSPRHAEAVQTLSTLVGQVTRFELDDAIQAAAIAEAKAVADRALRLATEKALAAAAASPEVVAARAEFERLHNPEAAPEHPKLVRGRIPVGKTADENVLNMIGTD